MRSPARIAVFASGEGTNLQALLDACASKRIRGEIVLIVSSNEEAGALRRAARAGIEAVVASPKSYGSPDEYNAYLAHVCKQRNVDLICLAGFMHQLRAPLLKAFPWRILNIHPALLPSFGGKGMYGKHVHEAVLKSGAKVSGCTVHFIDAEYDRGHIVVQATVPVLQTDTADTLSRRVLAQEHWAYPRAVELYCEGRLEATDKGLVIAPSPRDQAARIKRALLSVSDKTGLIEFARGLAELGVELVSTSGTAKALTEAGLNVRPLDTVTGFPEILQGRVKTLHPNIHGAILLRRRDPGQAREAELHGIEPIDLVCVNLYPFAATVAKASDPWSQDVIEQIDIGGVALIRAAAKNFEDVAVMTSPADYKGILEELEKSQGQLSLETRRKLALAGFTHTASYDAMISEAWAGGSGSLPRLQKAQDLRYGENPHQKASVWSPAGKLSFEQLHGKELSYNNLLDAAGTWDAVSDLEGPACVIFKHVTPCGVGAGRTLFEAFERAWACDPLCAFGGVLAFNRPVEKDIAEVLSKRFVEVITAPDYSKEALELLSKKPNVRLLKRTMPPTTKLQLRSIGDEVLVTEPDRAVLPPGPWKVVSKRQPTPDEEAALKFAWTACKHVKSNAIVLAGPEQTVGIGAGQMSRVDSVHLAGVKYKEFLRTGNAAPKALALASDAFFPFRDGIDAAKTTGCTAIIHPGGSIKDAEVIAAADEHGLAMIFTGMRHFRH